jgi:hypothetical protein
MPERSTPDGDPGLQRSLGRVEGMLQELSRGFNDFRREAADYRIRIEASTAEHQRMFEKHLAVDTENLSKIHTCLDGMRSTLERIRKPVDTFISIRRVSLGLLSILAALALIFSDAGHNLVEWFSRK